MRLCGMLGHKWGGGKFQQHCKRRGCDAMRTLVHNPIPKIGEPSIYWQEFDLTKIFRKL